MIKRAVTQLNWRLLLFGVFFLYFYNLVFYRYAPQATPFIINFILLPLMLVVMGFMFFAGNLKKDKLFWIAAAVFIFLCGLCLINNSGLLPHGIIMAFSTIGCFFIPFVVQKKHLEGFIKAFMASYVFMYFILGIFSIITVIIWFTGKEWAFGWLLRIKLWAGRLYVIVHPNITGLSFLVAAFFAIVLLFCVKAKAAKALLYGAIAIFTICLPLTNSRTALLAGCVCFGVLAGSVFFQAKLEQHLKKRIIGTVLSVAAGALAFVILNTAVLTAFNSLGTAFSANNGNAVVAPAQESEAEYVALPDRDIIGDDIQDTLNGRGYLWQGIFSLIKAEPQILLKGISPFNHRIMEKLIPYVPVEGAGFIASYTHTHSGYFFILLAFGIPGLIITAAFLAFLLKHSLTLVFLSKHEGGLPVYLFPAFITVILSAELVECYLTNSEIGYIMPAFFLMAGCICFYARQSKQAIIKK